LIAMRDELVNATEIARRHGISRSRVHQLLRDDPAFPAEEGTIGRQRVWRASTVAHYFAERDPRPGPKGRTKRQPPESARPT